jgi:hypothetical protein
MKWVPLIIVSSLLAGCAGHSTLYEWGSYQPALINYTKSADKGEFERELRESITKAEEKDRVPPGLYAELGYVLYEQGKLSDAAAYFAKEQEAFPESTLLMSKLIEGTKSKDAGGIQ